MKAEIITSGTERVETTYIAKANSDQIIALQLRGGANVLNETSLVWQQFKTVISKFKFD